jgi:hypothetical protein
MALFQWQKDPKCLVKVVLVGAKSNNNSFKALSSGNFENYPCWQNSKRRQSSCAEERGKYRRKFSTQPTNNPLYYYQLRNRKQTEKLSGNFRYVHREI